jgi:cell division initiation protein
MAMGISPMDIHLKEFSTVSTAGYNKEEVDSFLGAVADELEKLGNRNKELQDAVSDMRQKVSQFDEMQHTLQTALMNAQKSAGNILQEARSQAASIIRKAQERNDRILDDMQREKERILKSFSSIREQIVEQIPLMRELMGKSQGLLKEYEDQTRKMDLAEAAGPAEAEKATPPSDEPSETKKIKEAPELAATADATQENDVEHAEEHFKSDEEKYVWE